MESTYNPILHIEDDESDSLLLQRALVAAGISHPLQLVRNGARAIDYLLGQSPYERRELYPLPSLILLDLDLPLLNGFDFLKWRLTQPEILRIPVLVLTSQQQRMHVASVYEAGANSFLIKPLDFEGFVELARAIRQFWLMHNTFATAPIGTSESRFRVMPGTASGRPDFTAAVSR